MQTGSCEKPLRRSQKAGNRPCLVPQMGEYFRLSQIIVFTCWRPRFSFADQNERKRGGHVRQDSDFQHLQKQLLEAVFDESALLDALQTFADMCDAPYSQLMFAHRNRTLLRSTFSSQLDVDLAPTEALYQDINPRVLATPLMPKGKSTRDKDFISYDDIHKDQTYQELILPAGLGHFSGVPVIQTDTTIAGIALHRRISDDAFNDDEARMHELASAVCAPVLHMASMIEAQNVRSTLDIFGPNKAVAILDYKGYVLDQNQNFDALMRAIRAPIDKNRKLVLPTERERRALRAAIGSHMGIVGGAFVLTASASRARWVCRVFPKPAFTISGPEAGHALLVCERLDQPLRLDLGLIQEVYGLTQTESEIANAMFAGRTPREISERRRISLETVRSHIKSLLQKTESGRQVELVVKLSRLTDQSGA